MHYDEKTCFIIDLVSHDSGVLITQKPEIERRWNYESTMVFPSYCNYIIKHIGDVGNGCHVDCSMKHKGTVLPC